MHTLDIMLPFWGAPEYLYQTVDAVRAQDTGGWKLTVVDDCYPDEQVAQYFAQLDDPRVRYIRHETNKGITANYEFCVSTASADLVMLLGCDDLPDTDFVRRVLRVSALFPQADIIQPGVRTIDEDGKVVSPLADRVKGWVRPGASKPRLLMGEDLAVSLLRADWLYWPALVFRREALQRTPFRPSFPIIQDLALVIDMVAAGSALLLDPHVCFSYRRHAESASSAALFDGRRFDGERRYFELAVQIVRRNGWHRAARAAKTHSTSRAHALTLLPRALKEKNSEALKVLLGHAFGR